MFKITNGKGFWITFKNGYTVSVQFGIDNECSNKSVECYDDPVRADMEAGKRGSQTAEVVIWDAAGTYILPPWAGEDEKKMGVLDYQSAEEVLRILNWVARQGIAVSKPEHMPVGPLYDERKNYLVIGMTIAVFVVLFVMMFMRVLH